MRKLGLGIVGAAGGVGQAYILNSKLVLELDLKALCDLPEEKIHQQAERRKVTLDEVAKKNGVGFWTTNYEEMLSRGDVDVVCVGVPDYLHTDYALKALKAGKHVFLTKPIGTTLAEVKKLVKTVDETGMKFLASYGHGPMGETIKRIYDSGEIGEAFFVEGSYVHDQYEYLHLGGKYFTPWRLDKEHPRNYLIADGTHPLCELMRVLGEDVDEAFGYSSHRAEPAIPSDDFHIMIFKFKGGCIGKIVVTIGCKGDGMGEGSCNVYGTKGTIYKGKIFFHNQEPRDIKLEEETLEVRGHPFSIEMKMLVRSILNDEELTCPHDVKSAAKIISALWSGVQSAKLHRPVKVFNEF